MTKRTLNSDERYNNKKSKRDNDLEALWGDEELDESVFDDFIKFDSQVVREEVKQKDESILPDYEVFKLPRQIFCSTQAEASVQATTSKVLNYHANKSGKTNAETEIIKLRGRCEEKDGEVAVLRSQLHDMKVQNNVDFQKSQAEWKHKLSITEKQLQSIRSELEFKNLEIVNLKQKVLNLNKHPINLASVNDTVRSPKLACKEKPVTHQTTSYNKLYITVPEEYPLKGAAKESMFTILETEKCVIENKLIHFSKNATPYLQNKTISTKIMLDKGRTDMQPIYPIVLKLCESRAEEIDNIEHVDDINKIICITLQSLDNLFGLLQEIKTNLRVEDILEADYSYLKTKCFLKCEPTCENELGRKSSFIINFISEILPYCTYLKNYFFENKCLVLKADTFTKTLPYVASKKNHTGHDLLNKLIAIVSISGEIRKGSVMSSFLQSTINMFTNICKLKGYETLSNIVCLYTKEIIFLRPPLNIAFQFTNLLKEASKYTSFTQFLLNKTKNSCTTKSGVVYFNKDACRFYIFGLIFDRYLNKNKTVPLDTCLNMLFFAYNTYKFSYFIHHQDIKECDCLPQLYKLEIEIIFRILRKYSKEITDVKRNKMWDVFNKVVLKILNFMVFHCYDLIEKHITVYSQFKDIERWFHEQGVCDLERLNINEEIPEINSNRFDEIGF